jgi:nuclear protein localization family protein 4
MPDVGLPDFTASGFGSNGNSYGGGGETPSSALDAMGIGSPGANPGGSAAGGSAEVTCPHCTFVNPGSRSDCEICGLPLAG